MPHGALAAATWGFVSGVSVLLGALIGYYVRVSRPLIGTIMAFGAGVLISALAFDLMDEAFQSGGFAATAIGFLSGAVIFTSVNWLLSRRGGKHRKRTGRRQPTEEQHPGSGMAIVVGS